MNPRQFKRIIASYKAEITYHDKCVTGVIENLSETGVNVLTDFTENASDFLSGETVFLKIETPTGESLFLTCIIKWAIKILPHNLRNRIGLEIVDPPWDKSNSFL